MDQTNEALDNSLDSEAAVNEAAKKELEAPVAKEQSQQAEVTKPVVPAPAASSNTSPDKAAPVGQAGIDAQKPQTPEWANELSELKKQYAETRRWATQMAQERAQAKKELESFRAQQKALESRIKEATKQPFDLEKFNREFATHGFKAFDPYISEKLDEVKGSYDERLNALAEQNQQLMEARQQLEANLVIMQRKTDSEKYPDFAKLEPKMVEILNSPNCPIDRNLPVEEKLDAVYNLARTQHSEDAIKAAQKDGYVKAQAELAKEAKTAVATGGKGVSTTPANLETMPLDKLEQLVIQMHGIADRD